MVATITRGRYWNLVTILAFIYVPLNLASSIFGMNIQQLNDSGQSLKTFLVTAVVILLLTGGLWLCIAEVNGYLSWSQRPRRMALEWSLPRPAYNIAVRVRLLIWLYRHGHWTWARTTKAWWYILVNSRPVEHKTFRLGMSDLGFPEDRQLLDRSMSASEYVSEYMETFLWLLCF